MARASISQWQGFVKTIVWADLRDFLIDCIELNRDILEGVLTQETEESDEALRGRNRFARELLNNIEGWASGKIPIVPEFREQPDEEGD